MLKKAFDLIEGNIKNALESRGFVKSKHTQSMESIFIGEDLSYRLIFDENKNCFELYVCPVEEDGPTEEYKQISAWLFDPEDGTIKDAEGISNDFLDAISDRKVKAKAKSGKKKKNNDDNVNSLFFVNRLVNVFPDLKDEIKEEKDTYEDFRAVTFVSEKVNPRLLTLLDDPREKGKVKKLCTLLSDLYNAGDSDVRSIITIVILNSIEGKEKKGLIEENLSDDLKKAWKAALTFKGKKVKPEKKKKKKGFFANALKNIQQ